MKITSHSIVGEIVRANYKAAQVFEENKIDFCCGGDISLAKACTQTGINVELLIPKIASLMSNQDQDSIYIENLPLDKLCDYIVDRHHAYVNSKSPFIQQKLQRLCDVHGVNHPELFSVKSMFDEAVANLTTHMKKEELILFPYIRKLIQSKNKHVENASEFGNIHNPISVMMEEHQTEGDRFKKISEITHGYQTPPDGCNTYEITYRNLEEFEKDLHRHIHLENNILFPASIELEKELAN